MSRSTASRSPAGVNRLAAGPRSHVRRRRSGSRPRSSTTRRSTAPARPSRSRTASSPATRSTSTDVDPARFLRPARLRVQQRRRDRQRWRLDADEHRGSRTTRQARRPRRRPASDAASGGIDNHFASTLVLRNSVVSGNHVLVEQPDRESARVRAASAASGRLDVDDSVDQRQHRLVHAARWTSKTSPGSPAASSSTSSTSCRIRPATIRNTQITGNRVTRD